MMAHPEMVREGEKVGASLGKGKKVGRLEREDGGQWSEDGGQ
jgi:hypothetical protein